MKRAPSSALHVGLLLLLAMPLGCSKHDEPAVATPPKKVQPAKSAAQPAAHVQKQMSSAFKPGSRLDFRQRTDPFKQYAPVEAPPVVTGQPTSRNSADMLPIQSYEVSKFKVVGIVAGLKTNRALLVDPNGKGYVVQEGMEIGSNEGRITRITANAVEVVERFKEDNGRYKKRKVVLTLAKKR